MLDDQSSINHQSATIRCFPDLEALSWTLVDHFANLVHPCDRFCVALSGGHTPRRFYQLLGTRQDIEWRKVHLFLGDERYVPPSDERSNEKMIKDELVRQIDIPLANSHWMYDEEGWEYSAKRYDRILHDFFDGRDHTFDLALQGMGDDGHTASIFPGSAEFIRLRGPSSAGSEGHGALPEPDESGAPTRVVTTQGPPESPERLSCTLDCLAASREVLFVVAGKDKAERLKQVIDGDLRYPAAALASKAKRVEWWIDEAAASKL
ncbi:MAG TPA: 6-phosphogluconolactonase [Fimbriimonadaceae bacterium]|nr:6-phosphogluconolactonase [Fimbriimonadaceae bacterium]